jgi:F-type H+-transporting ATPase subunit delta
MKTNRLVVNGKIDAYATALVDNVYERDGREALVDVRNQMRLIIQQLRSNPKFLQFVKEENFSGEQLNQTVRAVLQGFNPVFVEVAAVMGENRDLFLMDRVMHAYDRKIADKYNVVAVDVTTAVELDDHLRQMIIDKVKAELGKDAIINESIDKDMLGGIVMTVQGKRIDASVRAQLNKARIELKKNTMEVKASD